MSRDVARSFVVEDHPVVRQTRHGLIDAVPGFVLHGRAGSAEEAVSGTRPRWGARRGPLLAGLPVTY